MGRPQAFLEAVLSFGETRADAAAAARLDNVLVFMYTVGNYGKRAGAVVKLCRIKVRNV